ncbi:hypothetical protein XO10_01385 [Marinitoga sp. 1135]|uniref:peptidogalycan biosysnthesis protein n=1 Tax=unclassified Marinitoga TaxID=2640159 RepID=UPI0009509724|nr:MULTISPECIES: peptidogalycan biosysnthesis protein [unclassified Marinitoga]APT75182.1 hypothetical protein LN42_01300 [Marinitoga sp. 1137]NUU94956.1 hypothetical protein [Marinitoga sp. 1135]NUU96925.1 hypothetical protein [Marinitoga sp. 1138]
MYYANVKLDIFKVESSFFKLNQSTPSALYRTKEWLVDSQQRLGDIPVYIELFYNKKPIALFPVIIFNKQSDYPPVDPHRIINEALGIKTNKPIAYCATLFGLGCPILFNKKEHDWDSIISILKALLKEKFNCENLVFGYFFENDDPFKGYTFNKNYVTIKSHKLLGILNTGKFTSFENYKKSLSKNTRKSYNSETNTFIKNKLYVKNLPIKEYDLDLIGKMSSNVFAKYGAKVDPSKISNFAKHISDKFPNNSGIISCWKDKNIISYVLYIKYNKILYAHTFGRNYELDKYKSYFLVAYHALIKYAIETGMEYINYGGGASWTKKRRGVSIIQTYSYVC